MRPPATGCSLDVNGRRVYLEESGAGESVVVFESGSGQGRTAWDRVVPLLADRARLVAYDRAGFGRSGRMSGGIGIDEMAADLAAVAETVTPASARLLLVGHSMGGLVVRRAIERLGARVSGVLLVDATPEQAPVYDHFDSTARMVRMSLLSSAVLVAIPGLPWLSTGSVRAVYPRDTYRTMLTEDFTPSGILQTRKEFAAVAHAIHDFRDRPPALPRCPTIVLSAARPLRAGSDQATISEYQRRYAATLPDGSFEIVDSRHFIQAEQPQLVADRITQLLYAPAR